MTNWAQGINYENTPGGLQKIKFGQIQAIQDLNPQVQPVFRVTLATPAGPVDLVVKQEMGSATHGKPADRYTMTAELMHLVSSVAKAEVLDNNEADALKRSPHATAYMKQLFGQPYTFWVKMKFKQGLGDLQSIASGAAGFSPSQIADLQNLVPKLVNNTAFWMSFGRIVAVDVFVGNRDRISWSPKKSRANLQNPGNVFVKFDANGNVKKAIGLDFFEGLNSMAYVETILSMKDWERFCLPPLKDQNHARTLASDVVAEIVAHVAQGGIVANYGTQEEVSFLMGFNAGIQMIKLHCISQLQSNKPLPGGVRARAGSLGWI